MQPRRNFPSSAVQHSQQKGRMQPLLCNSCTSAGYTARNMEAYPCRACNHNYGHTKFDADELRAYKNADNISKKSLKPLCTKCAQRVKALRKEVGRSKTRCTCKGAPNHGPLCPFNFQGNNTKASPWWPGGKEKTVTRDDKHFLDRANMPWWQKLNIPKGV